MADQGYVAPSFGDEDFDLPPLSIQNQQTSDPNQQNMYQQPQQMPVDSVGGQQPAPMAGQGQPQFPPQQFYFPPISSHHNMAPPTSRPYHTQAGYGAGQPVMMVDQYGQPVQTLNSSPGQASTSEDSDDCTPLAQLIRNKRPSPEPIESLPAKPLGKKPKVTKKKKKRDPNEPQKPVSAYALFFRDTQAAIKGQNPNASFGEVSKIVASMWDSLDTDSKTVYKKRTEAAKKEYLKALAAYRASLVSKGATDSESMYGSYSAYTSPYTSNYTVSYSSPNASLSSVTSTTQNQMSPLAKKSPLLTSLMNDNTGSQNMMGGPVMHQMGPPTLQTHPGMAPSSHVMQQQQQQAYMPQHMTSPPIHQHQLGSPPQQVSSSHQSISSPPQQQMTSQSHPMTSAPQQQQLGSPPQQQMASPAQQQMASPPHHQQITSPPQQMCGSPHNQQQQQMRGSPPHGMVPVTSPAVSAAPNIGSPVMGPGTSPSHGGGPVTSPHQGTPSPPAGPVSTGPQAQNGQSPPTDKSNHCIRTGCPNPAIQNPEWEDEYCSNECVVNHCRDVFNAWVASNTNAPPSFPAPVK